MPKIKTFLLLTLVLVFSISLFGCGPDTAAPEELTGQDGELPEWLLAAHRNVEGEGTETTDDLTASDDDGLVIEGDGATTTSAVQVTPVQPASTSTPAPTPAPAPAPAPAPEPDIYATPSPGTKEYAKWFEETGATGSYSDWLKEKLKKLEDEEKAEEEKDWFDGSPSGWGSD